mgnify:FL=1
MKWIKRGFLFGIIIFISFASFGFGEVKMDEEELFAKSFDIIGAEFLEEDINFGGAILKKWIDMTEMRKLGEELRNEVGIKGEKFDGNIFYPELKVDCYSVEEIEEDGFNQLTIYGLNDNGYSTVIILSSYKDGDKGTGETNLFIDMVVSEEYGQIQEIKEKTREIFTKLNGEAEITTCITGTISGKLSRNETENKISTILKELDGKNVETYLDENLVSSSIYTPYIDKYIYTGNKKMNYNIAMRYNEYEDKTYVWIGTPIITIGY